MQRQAILYCIELNWSPSIPDYANEMESDPGISGVGVADG